MQSHRVRERETKIIRAQIEGKRERKLRNRAREKERSDKLASGLCIWKTENLPNSSSFLPFMDLPVEGFG